MIEDSHYSMMRFQSPSSTISLLEHCWDNQETYNDHVETLRHLLSFMEAKAGITTGLWNVKIKKHEKLVKLLQKLDDLLLEIKADNA